MSLLEGVQVDFIRKNGVYMTVSCGEHGFAESDLHALHLQMLLCNEPPGIVRLGVERMNLHATLMYFIGGKRKLSTVLRTQRLHARELYRLLVRIASIVEESRPLMLDECGFVLDCDYIFVGDRLDDAHLVYLPLHMYMESGNLQVRWRKLVLDLAEQTDGLDADDFRVLLSDSKQDGWSLSASREVYLGRIRHGGVPDLRPSELMNGLSHGVEAGGPDKRGEGAKPLPSPIPMAEASGKAGSAADPSRSYEEELIPLANWDTVGHLKGHERRSGKAKMVKWLALAVTVIAIAALLIPHPWAKHALIGGAIIGVGAAAWSYWRLASADKLGGSDWDIPEPEDGAASSDGEPAGMTVPASPVRLPEHPGGSPVTMALNRQDATVVLSSAEGDGSGPRQAVLEHRKEGGGVVVTKLGGSRLTIGREKGTADLVLDTAGVSRAHCEIVRQQGQFGVVDLHSTNGTRLNGELLVPYKFYPLQEGDVIRVIDAEMTFKFGPVKGIMEENRQ